MSAEPDRLHAELLALVRRVEQLELAEIERKGWPRCQTCRHLNAFMPDGSGSCTGPVPWGHTTAMVKPDFGCLLHEEG